MASKMTANGVSTTTTSGTEQYEIFYNAHRPRRKHYQYLSTQFSYHKQIGYMRCLIVVYPICL